MKKFIFYIPGMLALLGLFAYWLAITHPEQFSSFLIQQQISQQAQQNKQILQSLNDTESISLFTIGTASPLPGNRAQTGTAVFVNGYFFMFDVGDGVVQKAENIGLPLDQLNGIFITHWHADHFIDLPGLINRSWLLGRQKEVHLYGPDGLDSINQAIKQFLQYENQHRVDHHGTTTMDISVANATPHEFKNIQNNKVIVFQKDGITITAFDVNHEPIEPAVGYLIEYKNKKVVISGDTKKNDLLIAMAKDADLLLHEVMLISLLKETAATLEGNGNERNAKIVTDIQDYHTSPAEVAAIATKANVKKLVLHHFAPPPDVFIIKQLYKQEMKAYQGPVFFANDGDQFIIK